MFKRCPFGFLVAVTVCAAPVQAHTSVEFLEGLQVDRSNLIEHGVEVKSFCDQQKVGSSWKGHTT